MNPSGPPASTLDAGSLAWLTRLSPQNGERAAAVDDLRALLLRASRFEVGRRRAAVPSLNRDDREELAQRCADDALSAVLGKLDEFRGDSRFTTWATKFALLEAAIKVRRLAWEGHEIPVAPERLPWPGATDATAPPPDGTQRVFRALQEAVEHELTPHGREVLLSLTVNNVPVDVLAERLNTTRGALYKTLHDARRQLRATLAARGIDPNSAQDEPAASTWVAVGLERTRTTRRRTRLAARIRDRWRAKDANLP